MMEQIRRREINCVVVKDLSRLGRAYLELILPLFGTRFISVNDNFDSNDYIGTTGGLELALRNLINSLYSRDLSVKIRSANKTRSRRGEYWGGTAFYGYSLDPRNKHKIIIDKNAGSIVVRIFDECIDGVSASQIAKNLNDENVPSPSAYKKMKGDFYNGRILEDAPIWTASTVLRILKDERYTGKMISNKRETVGVSTGKMRTLPKDQWIVVEGTHEPLVSQERFHLAATSLGARVKTVNKNTSGDRINNLFVCGYCGRKLQKSNGIVTHLVDTMVYDNDSAPANENMGEHAASDSEGRYYLDYVEDIYVGYKWYKTAYAESAVITNTKQSPQLNRWVWSGLHL